MASPAIVGTPAESATTAAGTSHVINLPSGAAGNLFLLVMGKGTTSATINALAGWNELVDEGIASGGFCAWRTCDGTEGATTTFTSSASTKSATIVYEISGQSAFAPEISAVAAASSAAPNPNTVTPTGGAKDYLWITWFCMGAASEEGDDDTWTNNAATGFGSLIQKTSGTAGVNIGAAVAASHLASNAASMDAVWPAASTDLTIVWRAFTVAVHPIQDITASPGAFTETGVLANLIADRMASADPGSFATTGVAATLLVEAVQIFITAGPGSFSATGSNATLLVEAAQIFITAGPGSFSATGSNATFSIERVLGVDAGSYLNTGVATTLLQTRSFSVDPAAFTFTNPSAMLPIARIASGAIACESGILSVIRVRLLGNPSSSWGNLGGGTPIRLIKNRKKL